MTTYADAQQGRGGLLDRGHRLIAGLIVVLSRIPDSVIAFITRFSIAAVFWKSGQTKIQGLSIDIVNGQFSLGWPTLSDSVVALFAEEYKLLWISPELGALLSAVGEHVLPILLLIGLATRFAALGLLMMTLVIQIFVYPDAYPTHGLWAAALLYLMAKGPGKASLDHLIALRCR